LEKKAIFDPPEETIVKEMRKSMCDKQRLQILKALSAESMTFSAIAQLTGLRGGDLLVHLPKAAGHGNDSAAARET